MAKVPQDRAALLEWVRDDDNLDRAAAAIRRQMSVYLSTGRLFAISHGPIKMDWAAVGSMISMAYGLLTGAAAFLDIGGHGELSDQAARLSDLAEDVRAISEDPEITALISFDVDCPLGSRSSSRPASRRELRSCDLR